MKRCRLLPALLLVTILFFALSERASAQASVQVKPWFLVITDTSGSMYDDSPSNGNACTNGATNQPTCTCSGCVNTNSCGWARTRISDAKCALRNILNSTGDAEFALMQYRHPCRTDCSSMGNGNMATTCDADLVVPISASNYTPLEWVDNSCQGDCTNGTRELYAYGYTPLGQSLIRAKQYFTSSVNGFTSPTTNDAYAGCRPVAVILLTDGVESCNGNANTAAASLLTSSVPTPTGNKTLAIKTYVVGFGLSPGNGTIEGIATAGGTDAPGTNRGFYAQDEETLSAALNQIIINSQLSERCDGVDNDCDTRVDEDNPKYCDFYGIRTSNPQVLNANNVLVAQNTVDSRVPACSGMTCPAVNGKQGNTACAAPEYSQSSLAACSPANVLCTSPGERCNGNDDDCDGKTDEAAPAIAGSNEVCNNNRDDDCDGNVDENCNGCIPQPEICNGMSEDCDVPVDEGLAPRACGVTRGKCVAGTETCTGGSWKNCTATLGSAETCNNMDDDCDGVVDGMTQVCGTSNIGLCRLGARTCTTGTYGACVGNVEPAAEICDKLDNDCDAAPNDDGSGDTRVAKACGSNIGVCKLGTTVCTNGEVVCMGATNGTTELCNGKDDDCDGNIDEGVAGTDITIGQPCTAPGGVVMSGPVTVTGECKLGTTVCSGGTLACQGYVGPSAELCDALDQNCNGNPVDGVAMTDPRVGQTCGTSLGECDPGQIVCTGNALVCNAGAPGTETCNSKDDDCDGLTDEQLPAVPTPCDGTGHGNVGLCKVGSQACIGGVFVCQGEVTPTPEICDGFDNDCDNNVDENNPGGGKICGSDIGLCTTGTTVCSAGQITCPNDVPSAPEQCDGFDNDCDGLSDEGNPQGGATCSLNEDGDEVIGDCRTSIDPTNAALPLDQPCGECRFGTEICQAGEIVCLGTVGIEDEVCDGLDNDCDSACVVDTSNPATLTYKCPTARCALPDTDPDNLFCRENIDEGVGSEMTPGTDPNIGVPCNSGTGACTQGAVECIDGVPSCVGGQVPVVETCNGKDDDCDTKIDEGFGVGDLCGTNKGECEAGTYKCKADAVICDGAVGPIDEICDGLDNNCDGQVDEGNPGGGTACGSDKGECSPGIEQCVSGRLTCVGEQPARPEVCDCLDNDCDGKNDEPNESGAALCPGGSECMNCQCAPPCNDADEFGTRCARGRAPVVDEKTGACFCEADRCDDAACAGKTLKVNDVVECAPTSDLTGPCVCKQNECVAQCNGVLCEQGLVCDPSDGTCKPKTCLLPQFRCEVGEFCDVTTGGCATDPCAKSKCAADQGCRDGECIDSCAEVTCDAGKHCMDGACVTDECAMATCDVTKVCNPKSGKCVEPGACANTGCNEGFLCNAVSGDCAPDVCLRTTCPQGQLCRDGECEFRCQEPELDCNGTCIDPSKDKNHCGASEDCQGNNAGTFCTGNQACSEGECSDTCKTGLNCNGQCIDPKTDETHCGATGDCQDKRAGEMCGVGDTCMEGVCRGEAKPVDRSLEERVVVTGGGGCACTVLASREQPSPAPWALVLGMLGAVLSRRRLRGLFVVTRAWPWLVILCALFGTQGCKVDTFCLNCEDPNQVTAGTNGGFGNADAAVGGGSEVDSGTGVTTLPDGAVVGGGGGGGSDAGGGGNTDAAVAMCIDHEICNGRDDDCDSKVDEGTDATAEGVNLKTDPNNCGGCGKVCTLAHAFNECVNGACKIRECDFAFSDLDGDDKNGCEYSCTKESDKDTVCDRRDNDCDGTPDDDIDFQTDDENCGSCANTCSLPHASAGSSCKSAKCELDDTKCDTGYVDADGVAENGCEHKCAKSNGGSELCDGLDNDCDTKFDEGVATTDPDVGDACGTSAGLCQAGSNKCIAGAIKCDGEKGPTTEICDGKNNDCDAMTDESFPQQGLPCGNDIGECVRGNRQCASGAIVCVGGVAPVDEECDGKDNDCDGFTDETHPTDGAPVGVGETCRTLTGGTLELNPPDAVGACKLGVAQCTSGRLVCAGEVGKKPELCDAIDQDCDGNAINGVATTDPAVGTACGTDLGECSFGTSMCNTTTRVIVCQGGSLPAAELCNGKDDDCDGKFDETDTMTSTPPVGAGQPCKIDGAGVVQYGPTVTTAGLCVLGTSVCSGGVVACPNFVGPKPELCDGLDQDCDSKMDEGAASTDARIGQLCPGSNVGACRSGTTYCNAGAIACQGIVTASVEKCDGIDNDCDADPMDDGAAEATLNQTCGTNTGACTAGTIKCKNASLQCDGQVGAVPESCDSTIADPNNPNYDNDCDTKVDEDFQLATNVNRCGSCSTVCAFTNATPKCTAGVCEIAACNSGYYNDVNKPGPDCDVGPCVIAGTEICNGKDDNCNGQIDENLTTPTNTCNTVGTCSGATLGCGATSGWVCSKVPTAETCNGIDDDCNGTIDQGYNVGAACSATGVGACATPGKLACKATGIGTECVDSMGVPVVAGTAGAVTETCNGKDDDCDGKTDEPCTVTDTNCVVDDWISLGNGTDIYKYEASRVDANPSSSGALGARSCSLPDRLPWTNVTYAQAQAACKAGDVNGRLCTEAEWEQACMDDSTTVNSCTWAFPDYPACTVWSDTQCNGSDYDSSPSIQTSGHSGANSRCYRGPTADTTKQIFELSGNVKEYTLQRTSGAIPVRGGATNNTKEGLSCGFDFPVWPNNSPFVNVGFRCCRNPAALPQICQTFQATGLDATNATLATHTIAVSPTILGTIGDVNVVNFRGTHNTMSQVTKLELVGPDATPVTLLNQAYCGNNDNWSYVFDDASATTTPSNTSPCGNGGTYKPFAALTAFNGKQAAGNWTIRVTDNSSSGSTSSPHINSWGVRICISQN